MDNNTDNDFENIIGILKGLSKRNYLEDRANLPIVINYINELLWKTFPDIPELTKIDNIQFTESHSFVGVHKTMVVTLAYKEFLIPCIHTLEYTKNKTFEEHAVSILKKEYNIDFNIDDIKFKWDGLL